MDATPSERDAYRLRPGSLYIVRGNGQLRLVGRAGLATDDAEDVMFPDLLIEVTPDPAKVRADFLAAIWGAPAIRHQIEAVARTSAGIHKINLANLGAVLVPVPTLEAQASVAGWLAHHRETLAGVHRSIAATSEATHGLRSQVVARALATPGAPRVPLGDLGDLTDGDWILNQDYSPRGVRLLQVGDVGAGVLTLRSNRFITEGRAAELRCTMLRPGDILISRMADPIGRACILPDLGYPAITAVDVCILRPKSDILDLGFAVLALNTRSWYQMVADRSSGATRPRISRRNLELLPIPLPSLREQRRIVAELRERLTAIDRMTQAISAQLEAVDALPAALLRRAFAEIEAA